MGKKILFLFWLLVICLFSFAQIYSTRVNDGDNIAFSGNLLAGSSEQRTLGIFEEGFEGFDDFTLHFSDWTTLDLDGRPTWGFENTMFPHQFEPMSFIVFSPMATTPALLNSGIMPYSGSKLAACFAANGATNNDWLISPPLLAGSNTSVSFYVKSYTSKFGLERYRVGVSNTDTQPESFAILTGPNYLTAPDSVWEQRVFDLNAYNGQTIYIAIHCVSDGAFIFMVDDFRFITVHPDFSMLSGLVSNALDGLPVPGAEVCIAGRCTITDSSGNYIIDKIPPGILTPLFGATPTYGSAPLSVQFNDESTENTHTLTCAKQGYLTYANNQVDFPPGGILNLNLSLSPELQEGNLRFVLNWGVTPTDLDSHLLTPEIDGNAYHVYFDNRGSIESAPFALLDFDITTGYGPETMTIYERWPGMYRYYVRNFSENPPITAADAVVQVYGVDGLLHTIQVPSSGIGNYWHVCDINGQTGDIIVKNNILADPPLPLFNSLPKKKETGVSQNRYINSWEWDFGDGTTSTLKNPMHVYNEAGVFEVSLTIDNGLNQETLLKEAYIQVGPHSSRQTDFDEKIIMVQLPGSNVLKVSSLINITNLRIIGMSGSVLVSKALNNNEIILDIGFLEQGIYIIEIESRDGRYLRKFSKW